MTLVEFIRSELRRLHASLDAAAKGLTPEQAHWLPTGNMAANHIAFELWHYARTEDNIVRFILQQRRPTVWMEGGWAEKLGLPPVAQGTGMPPADAQAMRIGDWGLFGEYVQTVWASTDEYLSHPDPARFDETVLVKPLGEMPAIRALGQVCMSHGFTHAGEIDYIRTLQGLTATIRV